MQNNFTTRSLLDWLRPRELAMTRLLGQFVRAESPSFDKAAVDQFGRIVASEWKKRGATVTQLRQRERGDHVRAEWRPRGQRTAAQILVLGHLDTVYEIGTITRMPFRLSRGRAWGPGAFDMKGGLVMALYAMDALAAVGCLPEKRIVFLWTSDEEIGSESSRAAIEREAKRSDAVLVLEPAAGLDGRVKTGRKGVGEIELIVTGRAPHVKDMRALERKFRALRPILSGAKLEVRGGFNRPLMERKMSAALYAKARALSKEMGLTLGEAFVGGGSDGNFTAALGVPTLDGL